MDFFIFVLFYAQNWNMYRLSKDQYNHYYQMLFSLIGNSFPISQRTKRIIIDSSLLLEVPKGHHMLEHGEIEKNVRFLCKGHIRCVDHGNNKSYIYDYRSAPNIVCEVVSLYSNEPSQMSLVTISDCHYMTISKQVFQSLAKTNSNLAELSTKTTAIFLGISHNKHRLFRTLSAEERYEIFLKKHPEIVKIESLTNISSYLGINPATLSRIRSRVRTC